MLRITGAVTVAALLLQGCDSTPPPAGIYSNSANMAGEYARREAALRGEGSGPGILTTTQLPPIGAGGQGTPNQPSAQFSGIQAGYQADPERRLGVQASPSNRGILSDEQNFDAVSSRESIESDAERRASQASRYHVVEPGALPSRTAETGPNIVDYALQTSNARGQKIYRRIFGSEAKMQRNCAKYGSSDAAQRDFLARGGPARDMRGLDPDGDGFACYWDPAPFRSVR